MWCCGCSSCPTVRRLRECCVLTCCGLAAEVGPAVVHVRCALEYMLTVATEGRFTGESPPQADCRTLVTMWGREACMRDQPSLTGAEGICTARYKRDDCSLVASSWGSSLEPTCHLLLAPITSSFSGLPRFPRLVRPPPKPSCTCGAGGRRRQREPRQP